MVPITDVYVTNKPNSLSFRLNKGRFKDNMSHSYKVGPKNQNWDSFIFVADYNKSLPDLAMWVSKFETSFFEKEGSSWATGWNDVVRTINSVCTKNGSKVSFLRLSCHGNVGVFALGNSIFSVKNYDKWKPQVQ